MSSKLGTHGTNPWAAAASDHTQTGQEVAPPGLVGTVAGSHKRPTLQGMSGRTPRVNTPAARVLFRDTGATAAAFSFVVELCVSLAEVVNQRGPRMQTPQQRQSPRHPLRRLANVAIKRRSIAVVYGYQRVRRRRAAPNRWGRNTGRVLADAMRRPTGRCWQIQGSLAARG